MAIAPDRLAVLEKIKEYERLGLFDKDVEDDPPTVPLDPTKVDYTYKKLSSKITARIATKLGQRHFEKMMKNGDVVLKDIRGYENLEGLNGRGVMVTCNHIGAFDSYAANKALLPLLGRRPLFKIIREGNYTSFKGLYGYFFRNCNTLPLTSSAKGLSVFTYRVSVS